MKDAQKVPYLGLHQHERNGACCADLCWIVFTFFFFSDVGFNSTPCTTSQWGDTVKFVGWTHPEKSRIFPVDFGWWFVQREAPY